MSHPVITVDTLRQMLAELKSITDEMSDLAALGEGPEQAGRYGYLLFMNYIKEDVLHI